MSLRSRASRRLGLAAGTLCVVIGLVACAARQPVSFSDRFVRPAAEGDDVPELLPRDETADLSVAPADAASAGSPDDLAYGRATPKTVVGATVERADETLATALAAWGAAPGVETALGVAAAYYRVQIWDKADDFLIAALDHAPRDSRLWALRARVWRDWGLPDLALGHATRAVYFAPESVDALNTLGTVLTMVGQFDEARRRFEAALALAPRGAYLLNNLCYLEIAAGRRDEARARCEAALALDPSLAAARENLARIGTSTSGGGSE